MLDNCFKDLLPEFAQNVFPCTLFRGSDCRDNLWVTSRNDLSIVRTNVTVSVIVTVEIEWDSGKRPIARTYVPISVEVNVRGTSQLASG